MQRNLTVLNSLGDLSLGFKPQSPSPGSTKPPERTLHRCLGRGPRRVRRELTRNGYKPRNM